MARSSSSVAFPAPMSVFRHNTGVRSRHEHTPQVSRSSSAATQPIAIPNRAFSPKPASPGSLDNFS